ncbi:DNA methyltransferase [Vampirovibrio chlorellavorus]|uniref:DNA methyltransferase n=1 Tax=Vampirovibrio chlorellavorus TaxID=758823 RepID=UPI0026E9343C|nr:DNA methyltransferase [Vampirovibrio chlorellavorus]
MTEQKKLFKTEFVPAAEGEGTLFTEQVVIDSEPVTCLGMTFENEEARRSHFTEELRKKLKDPEFRKIEGFPIGSDEDILNLSDPPYYTACPNPWITDFIAEWESQKPEKPEGYHYHREPFAADVSEGKNDTIYKLHSYHTKVPYKSITHFIEHFTEEGDIVLDAFAGSGMTSVASSLTRRKSISCDLSPCAAFVSSKYVSKSPMRSLPRISELIDELDAKYEKFLSTLDEQGKKRKINFVVWSDVFICPNCSNEFPFWENGVDPQTGKMHKEYPCPHCHNTINSLTCERAHETYFDDIAGKPALRIKRIPVLINYIIGSKGFEKKPDSEDLKIISRPPSIPSGIDYKPLEFIKGDMHRSGYHFGMDYTHHFFDRRVFAIALDLRKHLISEYGNYGLFVFTSLLTRLTKMNRFIPKKNGSGVVGPFSGTLYMPPLQVERNPILYLRDKVKTHRSCSYLGYRGAITSNQSSTELSNISDKSIDYIFVDPPFGANLMYSELNFLYESWLGVFTNDKHEAIQNQHQSKDLSEYHKLMSSCFREMYRVLKPGRWMTIEFHNSSNSVWQALQASIWEAGFVIADVRILDKKKITMLQGTHANIAKQDLVISAYRPNGGLEERFALESGTEKGVWDFVRTHLMILPVFVEQNGKAVMISERQNFLLFDRMLAFHVQRGVTVPLSTSDFYVGLANRFAERDGMYFLPEQIIEYDKKRISIDSLEQLALFVSDETSAIQWLRQILKVKPQSFQDIHPQFLKEIGGWNKNEKKLELSTLLEQNFIRYDGKEPVPEQIHTYLSSNWKDLRNLPKDSPALMDKARDRWFVPDPNKAGDLERLREKELLKEFEEYKDAKKKLKVFRLEAVRAGFKKAWQERDYAIIVKVAELIPNNVLEEDPKLLMWYDQAVTRMGGE